MMNADHTCVRNAILRRIGVCKFFGARQGFVDLKSMIY